MSALLTCSPEDAPLSVNFASGEPFLCGAEANGEATSCPVIQPADLFYGSVLWAAGGYPWQSRNILWDLGQFGGYICQVDDWSTYNLSPSDRWENINDFWVSLGSY